MALQDPFAGSSSPAFSFFAVEPHDTTDFPIMARALYVGGEGDVAAVTGNNVAVTFVGVPAGTILPIACRRVNDTNTDATNIVALV